MARGIVENDDTWRLFAPYELVWAGGLLGRAAVQGVYWGSRPINRIGQGLARNREQARRRKAERLAGRKPSIAAPTPPLEGPALESEAPPGKPSFGKRPRGKRGTAAPAPPMSRRKPGISRAHYMVMQIYVGIGWRTSFAGEGMWYVTAMRRFPLFFGLGCAAALAVSGCAGNDGQARLFGSPAARPKTVVVADFIAARK